MSPPVHLTPLDLGLSTHLSALVEWLQSHRAEAQGRIGREGAWWLSGFDVPDAAAFAQVVRAFEPETRPYVLGQSDRERVDGPVYTSTAYPAREHITLHGELSYLTEPPRWLLFHCEVAPDSGGETPLTCGGRLLDALPDALVDRFNRHGLTYRKYMHGGTGFGKSWQRHFETDDRETVEATLAREGARVGWTVQGGLSIALDRPATRDHPTLRRSVWCAQAALWHPSNLGERGQRLEQMLSRERLPTDACFGDGGPIDAGDLETIRKTAWALAKVHTWKPGNVVIIDNLRMLHGRAPFTGGRTVRVAMAGR